MKRLFPFLPAVLLTLSLFGLAACGETDTSRAAAQLEVSNFEFTRLEQGTRLFTGSVYNPSGQPVRQAQIRVTLLDAQNRQVGSALIDVRNIAARDTTAFRQPLDSDQEVSGARVKSLTVL